MILEKYVEICMKTRIIFDHVGSFVTVWGGKFQSLKSACFLVNQIFICVANLIAFIVGMAELFDQFSLILSFSLSFSFHGLSLSSLLNLK